MSNNVTAATEARRNAVLDLRRSNPQSSLRSLANCVGLSRERVRQILLKNRVPARARKVKAEIRCEYCGRPTRTKKYCSLSCAGHHGNHVSVTKGKSKYDSLLEELRRDASVRSLRAALKSKGVPAGSQRWIAKLMKEKR